jgi:excisionase family DNA binding protein
MNETLLTVPEAAQRLQVSESWLRKRIAAEAVPCVRLGRSVRFSQANVAAIVAAHTTQPVNGRALRSTA